MQKQMTIKKQLLIFAVIMVILPMMVLYVTAHVFVVDQIRESQKNYLSIAMKVARSEMHKREYEMLKVVNFLGKSSQIAKEVQKPQSAYIEKMIDNLQESCQYLDFIVVVDENLRVVAQSSEDIQAKSQWDLNGLIAIAMQRKAGICSEEVTDIADVFVPQSASYKKFVVSSSKAKTEQLMTKMGVGVAISPIFSEAGAVLGAIIVGDIVNNDDYFPNQYSAMVNNSFLAFSIDGIRVTSNISTGLGSNYVGTKMPVDIADWQGKYHFGKVKMGNEQHIFLDEEVKNYRGEVVSVIGVGIPEQAFSGIVTNNYVHVAIVAIFCLAILLFLARIFAQSITKPIVYTTDLAKQIAEGKRDLEICTEQEGIGRENMILLSTFRYLLEQIKRKEADIDNYIAQLHELNGELENKIASRTVALEDALQQLLKADRVKNEFLANMGHELRTPLSVIISSVDLLGQEFVGELNDKQKKYANNILQSATNLLQLINDILDLSKINAGKMNISYSQFYLCSLANQVIDELRSLTRGKEVELKLSCEPADFLICADAIKVKQIFYNLVSNAIKFTDAGEVTVTISLKGDICEVVVRDTGIGIAPSNYEKVFQEFVQVDNSYQRKYEGTGLGLPLTKKLVEMHGGHIFLKSKLHKGTEVLFTLPIKER